MKITFFTLSILLGFSITVAFAQTSNKPIYFFADTLNVDPKLNIIDIGNEGPIYYYSLHCLCMPPYYNTAISFKCYQPRDKSKITQSKPDHKYIYLKELMDISIKTGGGFDSVYDLSIVEPLPNGAFRK